MAGLTDATIGRLLEEASKNLQHFFTQVSKSRALHTEATKATLEASQAVQQTDVNNIPALLLAVAALKEATDAQARIWRDLSLAATSLDQSNQVVDDLKREIARRIAKRIVAQ